MSAVSAPPKPPHGKPIPSVTNLGDVEWALSKAYRYVWHGGDPTDPRYREYVDRWLDYRLEIVGTPLEHAGIGPLHRMHAGGVKVAA